MKEYKDEKGVGKLLPFFCLKVWKKAYVSKKVQGKKRGRCYNYSLFEKNEEE